MTMAEVQDSILADLIELNDPLSRAEYAIACARQAEILPDELRTDSAQVADCQANTWVIAQWENDRLCFRADSESFLVKGMLALIREIYEGRTRQEIESFSCLLPDAPTTADLLTPEQRRGLRSILSQLSKGMS